MVSGFEDEQIELTGILIWWTTGHSYHIVSGKSAIFCPETSCLAARCRE